MTGWRLGYCMADAKLMDRIRCSTSTVSPPCPPLSSGLRHGPGDGHQRCGGDLPQAPGLRLPAPGGHGPGRGEAGGRLHMFVDIRKFGMDSNTFCPDAEGGPGGRHPRHHFGTEGSCA
ncbi:MAG: hypothetical protein ACLTYN_07110 [Dysosmobacter welbionis]